MQLAPRKFDEILVSWFGAMLPCTLARRRFLAPTFGSILVDAETVKFQKKILQGVK
jgi:hypothetical protein